MVRHLSANNTGGVITLNGLAGAINLTSTGATISITPVGNNIDLEVIGGSAVTSVSNADGTLTISPTTGAVVASRAAITGDISVPIASNAATLATVNSNVGSFGTASSVGSFTVNAKGLTTAAANVAIQIAESQVTNLVTDLAAKQSTTLTNTHILVGNAGNVATDVAASGDLILANTGAFTFNTVNANVGSFGTATQVSTVTVNAKGLITAASNTSIQITESQVTNLTTDLAGKQPLDATLTALAAYDTNGILTQTATDTFTGRQIRDNVTAFVWTNGNGVAGDPSLGVTGTSGGIPYFNTASDLTSSGLLVDNSIIVGGGAGTTPNSLTAGLGTTTTLLHGNAAGEPTWAAVDLTRDVTGVLPVLNGGTGQSTYTNGQLLIGNTTGNTLTKATLTGTANQVVVTNGTGSITLSTPQDIATGSSVTFANINLPKGGALRTQTGDTDFFTLSAYDVDGAAYFAFITLTASNTPKCDLSTSVTMASNAIYYASGPDVAVADGGTNISSYAQGDLLYASSSSVLATLAKNTTATRYLSNTGTSNNPVWAQVDVSNGVTGDLPFANLTQGSARSVLGVTGNSTADVASIQGAADQALVINGAGTALAFGTVATNGITNNAVTYAKMQQATAFKVLANDTNATANIAEANFQSGVEAAYTGTVTWTAGAAPSSTANLRQYFTQVANLVAWQISLTYATTGTTVTAVSLTFPTEFPTPDIPTGFTGADVNLFAATPARFITTPSGSYTISNTVMLKRNSADTGFVIAGAVTSGSYRTLIVGGIYFTA